MTSDSTNYLAVALLLILIAVSAYGLLGKALINQTTKNAKSISGSRISVR